VTVIALAALLALAAQAVLQTPHVWWVLAACRPHFLVVVAAAPKLKPVGVAWLALALGLAGDVLTDRAIGPGGISGAVAGLVVAVVVRRFELEGPLFWIAGALLATGLGELVDRGVTASLGMVMPRGWLGSLATVATTVVLAAVVAAGAWAWSAFHSTSRQRRRALRRL